MFRWAVIFALLLTAQNAHASVLYQDTATSSNLTGNSSASAYFFGTTTYPTVPDWDVDSVVLQMRGCVGFGCSGLTAILIAEVWNGTAWVGVATSSSESITSGSTPETIQFDYPTFNLSDAFSTVSGARAGTFAGQSVVFWYRFRVIATELGLTNSHIIWGHDLSTTTAPFNLRRQDGSTIVPAVQINGSDVTSTVTRIASLDAPANGATTPSTSVTFQWTVYFNDTTSTQDVTGIEISNISGGQSIVQPVEQTINASGFSIYTTSKTLNADNEYLWRAYMRDTTGTQGYVYSSYNSFFVVSNPYPQNLNIASTSVGSTTSSILPNYQSLAEFIRTKPPFGFIFQTIDALENLNASSTPAFELEQEDNIKDSILSPLDIGLAWIIGLLFTMYVLRRFSHLEI